MPRAPKQVGGLVGTSHNLLISHSRSQAVPTGVGPQGPGPGATSPGQEKGTWDGLVEAQWEEVGRLGEVEQWEAVRPEM